MRTEYWSSNSGRIELSLPLTDCHAINSAGQQDDNVHALSKRPSVAEQLFKVDPQTLRDSLREYGAWDAAELADHAQNLQRLLWIAACDLSDEFRTTQE